MKRKLNMIRATLIIASGSFAVTLVIAPAQLDTVAAPTADDVGSC